MNRERPSAVAPGIKVPGFLIGLLAATLALPAAASAGTYVAEGCSPGNTSGIGVVRSIHTIDFNGGLFLCGNDFDGGIRVAAAAVAPNGNPLRGFAGWTVEAPENTTIQEVRFERTFAFAGPANGMVWRVRPFGAPLLESVQSGTTPPANGVVSFPVNAAAVTGTLACSLPEAQGCMGGQGSSTIVTSRNFVVRAADLISPTISVSPPSPTTPLRGTVEIPYEARDLGSGVAAVALHLDPAPGNSGEKVGESRDDNGGECREPFRDLLPCKLQVNRSISFDTTRVPNGSHTLLVAVADAASNVVSGSSFPVVIDNPPPDVGGPDGGPGGRGPGGGGGQGGTQRPQTTIAKHPPKRASSLEAKFTFRSDQPGSRFECKRDRRPFKACRSPFKGEFAPGRHTFRVRAVDRAGNPDLTPAVFRWRVL